MRARVHPRPFCAANLAAGLIGRSMDWKLPKASNLWLFPRGMARDGAAGERSGEWTAP